MRLSATLFIFGLASITCTGAAPQPMDTRAHANAPDTADAERRTPSPVVPSIHTRNKIIEVHYRKTTDVRTARDRNEVAKSGEAIKDFLSNERAREALGISGFEIEVQGEFYGFLQYDASKARTLLASHTRRVSFTFGAESPGPCYPLCAGLLDINSLMGTIRDSGDQVIYTTNPKQRGLFYRFILVT
ncbi:hypothetical protein GG344DRAFT_79635 [Lentinula edodes]|nr:hypothetical protein GG344DRAFT_79635 [Lentinula edodes]